MGFFKPEMGKLDNVVYWDKDPCIASRPEDIVEMIDELCPENEGVVFQTIFQDVDEEVVEMEEPDIEDKGVQRKEQKGC